MAQAVAAHMMGIRVEARSRALARGREALRAIVSESLDCSEVTAVAGLRPLKRKGSLSDAWRKARRLSVGG
jgi:hypothetical protein